MAKQLSDREIEEILFKLRERLDVHERERVREMLKSARHGGLYKEELHKELVRLRDAYKISESDHQAIEKAVFGD